MSTGLLNIEIIKEYVSKGKINWTKHCLNRLNKREISQSDVKTSINNGQIIEYYYDDYPYPSCLIIGNDANNHILHIVCGVKRDILYMITAYYPDSDRWEDDMKTRRKE